MAKDSVKSGISITGAPGVKPEQITFSNLDITFPGGGTAAEGARRSVPDLERAYPEYCIFGVLPAYGLYAHHVRGITLNNVQFHLDSDDFRPAIVCDDVQNVQVTGLQAEGRAGRIAAAAARYAVRVHHGHESGRQYCGVSPR